MALLVEEGVIGDGDLPIGFRGDAGGDAALCEGASAAASAKANKAELIAVPRQVSEGRKSTARPAATWEASRRTTDMTVLATFTSLDYPAII